MYAVLGAQGPVLTKGACERKRATDEATIGACDVFITGDIWECTKVACEGIQPVSRRHSPWEPAMYSSLGGGGGGGGWEGRVLTAVA